MSLINDFKLQFKSGDVVTKLIFWNIILFAVPAVVFAILNIFLVNIDYLNFVNLSSNISDLLWKPWSLISYSFFHFDFFHILFNLLMLNFVGRLFLTFFTQKQLLNLYFVGAIFAGFIYLLSYQLVPILLHVQTSLIGASASVMAILFATVTYAPYMQVRLMFFGNVKLWHIAFVILIIDLIQLPTGNSGGHLSHIGGAFFGYLYIYLLKKGTDICTWFGFIIDQIMIIFSKKERTPFTKVHRNYNAPITKSTSKIVTKDVNQQKIDDILDKISQSGYDSLTKEEKEFLFKAGK